MVSSNGGRIGATICLGVLAFSVSAFADEPARRVPAKLSESCRPMLGKAQIEFTRLDFDQLAETIGRMACVQFEFPSRRIPARSIELSKQEMTTEQVLQWLEGQLTHAGYRLTKVSDRRFRIEEIK